MHAHEELTNNNKPGNCSGAKHGQDVAKHEHKQAEKKTEESADILLTTATAHGECSCRPALVYHW